MCFSCENDLWLRKIDSFNIEQKHVVFSRIVGNSNTHVLHLCNEREVGEFSLRIEICLKEK